MEDKIKMNENIQKLLENIDEEARKYDVYKYGLPAGRLKELRKVVEEYTIQVLDDVEKYIDEYQNESVCSIIENYKQSKGLI